MEIVAGIRGGGGGGGGGGKWIGKKVLEGKEVGYNISLTGQEVIFRGVGVLTCSFQGS